MKVTKEYLKQLIIEQMNEQEEGEKAFDQAFAQSSGGDIDKTGQRKKIVPTQELRRDIMDTSKKLAGIMQNEMDIVEFALGLIAAAKQNNLNVEILRRRLGLVQDELQKITKAQS